MSAVYYYRTFVIMLYMELWAWSVMSPIRPGPTCTELKWTFMTFISTAHTPKYHVSAYHYIILGKMNPSFTLNSRVPLAYVIYL